MLKDNYKTYFSSFTSLWRFRNYGKNRLLHPQEALQVMFGMFGDLSMDIKRNKKVYLRHFLKWKVYKDNKKVLVQVKKYYKLEPV